MSSDSGEISVIQLLRFNFSPVSCNNSFSNSLADLGHFKLFLVLVLNFDILLVLSLFPLFSMLFIMAEGRGVLDYFCNWCTDDPLLHDWRGHDDSLRGARSHWSGLISVSVIDRLIFYFLSNEMSVNVIRDIPGILSSIFSYVVCDVSWSVLSILRFKLLSLESFRLVGSRALEVVST